MFRASKTKSFFTAPGLPTRLQKQKTKTLMKNEINESKKSRKEKKFYFLEKMNRIRFLLEMLLVRASSTKKI